MEILPLENNQDIIIATFEDLSRRKYIKRDSYKNELESILKAYEIFRCKEKSPVDKKAQFELAKDILDITLEDFLDYPYDPQIITEFSRKLRKYQNTRFPDERDYFSARSFRDYSGVFLTALIEFFSEKNSSLKDEVIELDFRRLREPINYIGSGGLDRVKLKVKGTIGSWSGTHLTNSAMFIEEMLGEDMEKVKAWDIIP